jgi:branched-chain amino acid transport system substrate-binding protein
VIEPSIDDWKAAARLPSVVWRTACAAIVALSLIGATAGKTDAHAAEPDVITIAIAAPLSGPRASLGRAVVAAATLATQDLATHDLATPDKTTSATFRMLSFDDGCNTEKAASAATEIIAANVAVVIGHPCANAAAIAAPLYAKAGLLFIATGATQPPAAAKPQPLHFRIPAAETPIGSFIGNALAASPADARIALLRDRTLLARGIIQDALKELTKRGRTPALIDAFAGGDKDYSGLVARMKAAGITHLGLAAFPNEGALLVAEARAAIPELTIIATDLMADPETARVAGAHAEGMRVAMSADLARTPQAKASIAAIHAAIAADPSQPLPRQHANAALATQAAIEAFAATAKQSTPRQAADVARLLKAQTHATSIGDVSFNEHGDLKATPWALYAWRAGTLVAVDP